MSLVAVSGDLATSTTVALASAWPTDRELLLVEADPTGGDLAAWFDMPVAPSLSTVVTSVLDGNPDAIDSYTRLSPSGLRILPAPARRLEADRAVDEAGRSLVPALAANPTTTTLADCGAVPLSPSSHPFLGSAMVAVVVHRQSEQSSLAAAVRLQRFVDSLAAVAATNGEIIAVVAGQRPYDFAEVVEFIVQGAGEIPIIPLPIDDLTANVYAGRQGVSARRLARLPLSKAAVALAHHTVMALDRRTGRSEQMAVR